jgi:hypothetical protein
MTSARFEQANIIFGPPMDLDESQCGSIPAYAGQIQGGSCDGLASVVVAYHVTKEEAERLMNGELLYFTMIGGLAPHYPSLSFHEATHPA